MKNKPQSIKLLGELVAAYILAHPGRPVDDLTVVEVAVWRVERRKLPTF